MPRIGISNNPIVAHTNPNAMIQLILLLAIAAEAIICYDAAGDPVISNSSVLCVECQLQGYLIGNGSCVCPMPQIMDAWCNPVPLQVRLTALTPRLASLTLPYSPTSHRSQFVMPVFVKMMTAIVSCRPTAPYARNARH